MSQITKFPMLKCCAVHHFERNYTPGTPPYPALASPHSLKCSYSLSKVTVITSGPQWKPWAKMFINSLGHPVVNSRPSREQKHHETYGDVSKPIIVARMNIQLYRLYQGFDPNIAMLLYMNISHGFVRTC